eukprot:jgi/Chlat1/6485/Chrsp45S05978
MSAAQQQQAPSDDVSLLVLIVEANPFFWARQKNEQNAAAAADNPPLTAASFLRQVIVFINAYLLLHFQNRLVVLATHHNGCDVLYESHKASSSDTSAPPSASGSKASAAASILRQLKLLAQRGFPSLAVSNDLAKPPEDGGNASLVSGALSLALCYIHKASLGPPPHAHARILVLQGSPDHPPQYIAVMNSIFSAQRSGVPVDACVLGASDSPFLQQAAHITGGVYARPRRPAALLQYLMTIFGADAFSRQFLQLPKPTGVDFCASCFCHKRPIDLGYVCSVCLSIFCQPSKECSTCGTVFSTARRKRGQTGF